ncbi:MAG: glucosamine-6-phosphate deaminase [Mycoplasma sp.]
MEIKKFDNEQLASQYAAELIISKVKTKESFNLGAATGTTPVCLYGELVKDHKENGTDWSNVKTFNLDEYEGVAYDSEISYHRFMKDNLFDHINIKLENTFFPEDGVNFEDIIKSHNGVDLQILGLGVNGHIGFNEPGSTEDSVTRIVDLTQSTIDVNAKKYFNSNSDLVPKTAISMGLETIMRSKEIILLAFGDSKSEPIERLVNSKEFDPEFPASILVKHPNVTIIVDSIAASKI